MRSPRQPRTDTPILLHITTIPRRGGMMTKHLIRRQATDSATALASLWWALTTLH
jgi:hypothetical protein